MYLHVCVLCMFMDLEPPEETQQEQPHLPLTTEPGCSGEQAAHLDGTTDSTPGVSQVFVCLMNVKKFSNNLTVLFY